MSIFNGMNISSSALTAQRLRMDTVSTNIANADSTRARINEDGEFEPYRRKVVNFQSDSPSFKDPFSKIKGDENKTVNGVKVPSIT